VLARTRRSSGRDGAQFTKVDEVLDPTRSETRLRRPRPSPYGVTGSPGERPPSSLERVIRPTRSVPAEPGGGAPLPEQLIRTADLRGGACASRGRVPPDTLVPPRGRRPLCGCGPSLRDRSAFRTARLSNVGLESPSGWQFINHDDGRQRASSYRPTHHERPGLCLHRSPRRLHPSGLDRDRAPEPNGPVDVASGRRPSRQTRGQRGRSSAMRRPKSVSGEALPARGD
jgi:hypothetical protein